MPESINDRVRKLRKALDLTQKDFGEKIGMKQNTIALIESGRNTSEQTIFSICREFNVNEEWLRTGNGEMFKASPSSALDALAAEYGLDHGSYIAIEKFLKLKPDLRSGIIAYFKEVTAAMSEPEQHVDEVAAAEAAYEKTLDSARSTDSTASSIIEDTEGVG